MKRKYIVLALLLGVIVLLTRMALSPYPSLYAQNILFKYILPPFQKLSSLNTPYKEPPFFGFKFENPQALQTLKNAYKLDTLTKNAHNDFERDVLLMHWVRDQFPHGTPASEPNPQSFDGYSLLQSKTDNGYLCGTASQLLIQAIIATGGQARRVELRFTPENQHAVVEAWSAFYNKWVVLDPDYDIYYMRDNIPQHALELHEAWVKNEIDKIEVVFRESPHNIYRKEDEKLDPTLLRKLYDENKIKDWYKKVKKENFDYYKRGKFAVKLLHFYTHLSYPLRTDWVSRPLNWWHPEGNHVQNSLTFDIPSMPRYDDFLLKTKNPEIFYKVP
ncbi:transglutaminase-like domain-containing protein [bacterium]|nr:transglutaminase-like domain-containing protein [bacterium]